MSRLGLEQALLDRGTEILGAQPFSRLLGTSLVGLRRGYAELGLTVMDGLKQQNGFVHGGVISCLADNVLTFAGGSEIGGGAVTSAMKINYLRPAIGQAFFARAQTIGSGRSQAVVRCDVFVVDDGAERLCAVAQGTIVAIGERAVEKA